MHLLVLDRFDVHQAGTPEEIAATLRAFATAGAQTLVLRFGAADQAAQLEGAAADLLPRLR